MPNDSLPSASEFRVALDEAAIVAVTDRAGRIVDCNDRFCTISGYSRDELIGQNHRIINSGHHDKAFFLNMYETISHGHVWKGTICNRRKDGELYWVDTTIVPTRDSLGRVNAYIALRFEVTNHVAALDALEAATDQVRQAGRAKDEFLANMSHEVRTPLNGIIGLAAALTKGGLEQKEHHMAQLILNSGESLRRILDDILDVAKVEAGQMVIEPHPFDLREEVLAAAELMRIRADEKGLGFNVAFDESADGWFEADPFRLRQVLANLISNAIKFTETGWVEIAVSVSPGSDGSKLMLEVADTGIGFDEATAEKLFDRFVQADGSTARRFGGTGLGLAISNALVALMGGSITARSTPGVGSIFCVILPVRPAQSPEQPEAASESFWVGDIAPKVLCAEDHPTNRLVMQHLLEPLGATIVLAGDGAEAVERFSADDFDLILMDMQMPIMDGLTAVSEIRKLEHEQNLPRIPIAMLTANTSNAHREAATRSGADGFISKPLTPETLVAGINELLALRLAVWGSCEDARQTKASGHSLSHAPPQHLG